MQELLFPLAFLNDEVLKDLHLYKTKYRYSLESKYLDLEKEENKKKYEKKLIIKKKNS